MESTTFGSMRKVAKAMGMGEGVIRYVKGNGRGLVRRVMGGSIRVFSRKWC